MNEQQSRAIASELAQCVRKNRGCRSKITKEAYVPAFEAFEADCASALDAFAQSEVSAQMLGEQVLQALAAQWQTLGKQERTLAQEADRIVLALFLIPAIRRRETDRAESLAAALQEAWASRFPQSRFQLVLYHDGGLQAAGKAGRLRRADRLPPFSRRLSGAPAGWRGADCGVL